MARRRSVCTFIRDLDGKRLLDYTDSAGGGLVSSLEGSEEMRTPHFMRLAQIDEDRFISACRHGLVHLTWARATVRVSRDEFRRLVALLNRAASAGPPATFHDGDFRATTRLDAESEIAAGSWVLQLSPDAWHEFAGAAREALHRLDEILASGMWDGEPEESQSQVVEGLRRVPFSKN